MSEAMSLASAVVAALLYWLVPVIGLIAISGALVFVAICQVAVISSIVTGLIRRRHIESADADDMGSAAGTFALNYALLCLMLVAIGALNHLPFFELTLIPIGVAVAMLVASPLIIPVVQMSQRQMTKVAKEFASVDHA